MSSGVKELSEGDIHLWYSPLDLPASSLGRLETTLNEDERQRAEHFCSERERSRFVAARGLLRRILGDYVGVEPSELQFSYGRQGKPSLTERFGGNRIQFNLAHSSGYVIYAVTLSSKVGVDLERIAPVAGLEQLVSRFFSDREKKTFDALAGSEKQAAFFKIWTAKEACLKASGEGLAHLDKIDVLLDQNKFQCSLKMNSKMWEDSHWSLEQLRPASNFMAAVVAERFGDRPSCLYYPEHPEYQ